MSQRLEQIFTSFGIPQESIDDAKTRQSTQGGSLRENLLALHHITEDAFSQHVSNRLRVPYINLKDMTIADDILALLPREKAEKYLALPLELDSRHRRLTIAMADPADMLALDELKFVIGYTLIPQYTPEDELIEAIQREYVRFEEAQVVAAAWSEQEQSSVTAEGHFPIIDVSALNAGEPLMRLVGAIFMMAYSRRASEIHLAPTTEGIHVSLRIDGQHTALATFPRHVTTTLLHRLRRTLLGDVMERASMVQKGTAVVKLQNKKECDLSYSIYPAVQGEHVLIKIKDRYHLPNIEDLMLAESAQQDLHKALSALHGIVLVTGTAKSGVTTTLYALLNTLNQPHLNIVSVEDPIEALIDGIAQGSLREEADPNYEEYLHYAVHQHPDVLMIDHLPGGRHHLPYLANLASGALVMSAFPATNTASAVFKLRLLMSPEFMTTHVRCITAQRLVRTICESCKEDVTLPEAHRQKLGFASEDRCYAGKGCEACQQTGYNGVAPIFEVMLVNESVKQAIREAHDVGDIRALHVSNHVFSLRDDGMRKVKQGVTTVQEVLRTTML